MKIRTFLILVLAFFIFCMFIGRVSTTGNFWPERVDVSYAISLTLLAAGGLFTLVSLFVLLQRGLSGQSLDQCLPIVFALLGGLLLYNVNWGVALAFGLMGSAAIIGNLWNRSKPPQ